MDCIHQMLKMDRIKVKPIVKSYKGSRPRKPSIKITVSADVPEVDIFSSSPVRSPSPQTVVKRIMTYGSPTSSMKRRNRDRDRDRGYEFGFDVGGSDEQAFTRITVDDSVVDFPNCIDFGIKDFLCCKDEIDLELSSDTDTSYLEATPPHRFSDSELENQIEIMSITLDNALNLPKRTSFTSKDDLFTFDLIRFESQTHQRDFDIDPESYQARIQPKLKHYSDTSVETDSTNNSRTTSITDHDSNDQNANSNANTNANSNIRRMPPPPRPFRRHISLPASIFMSYLMAEQNLIASKDKKPSTENISNQKNLHQKFTKKNFRNDIFSTRTRKLTRIDGSYSSNESTDGSPNENETDNDNDNDQDQDHDSEGHLHLQTRESMEVEVEVDELSRGAFPYPDQGDSSSISSRDTPLFSQSQSPGGSQSQSQSGSEVGLNLNRSDTLGGRSLEDEEINIHGGEEDQAFTSEIERKSLMIRYMRKLIRQDTSGNFAPPDYCI